MRVKSIHRYHQRYSGSKIREGSSRYRQIKDNPIITNASRVINTHIISIGTLNQSLIHPREVFYPAIQNRAAAIIIAHNHPSGQLHPSNADISVTKRLKDAGKLIGIDIIGHIILTTDGYYSFQDEGTL